MLTQPIKRITIAPSYYGLAAILSSCFVLIGCGGKDSMPEDPVAIEVNDRAIRLSELQAQIDSLLESGAPITSNPERFLTGYI